MLEAAAAHDATARSRRSLRAWRLAVAVAAMLVWATTFAASQWARRLLHRWRAEAACEGKLGRVEACFFKPGCVVEETIRELLRVVFRPTLEPVERVTRGGFLARNGSKGWSVGVRFVGSARHLSRDACCAPDK
jgi:hypothetical protein